jgi:hypothetical protein
MANTKNLHKLVEGFAARVETLQLSGDEQEAYSTMLCRLENQADREEPNYTIIVECMAYFSCFSIVSAPHAA